MNKPKAQSKNRRPEKERPGPVESPPPLVADPPRPNRALLAISGALLAAWLGYLIYVAARAW